MVFCTKQLEVIVDYSLHPLITIMDPRMDLEQGLKMRVLLLQNGATNQPANVDVYPVANAADVDVNLANLVDVPVVKPQARAAVRVAVTAANRAAGAGANVDGDPAANAAD
ncbi:hypothetical protein DAPPUDRAFT_239647 [Daphnia pulex]|uniref:Uncharacterized protein n=1 Tax=Daphnia pulex TaxID=6669 RepID=E9G9R6_DAPPU|nr:hypothetical protein DAPPUDRAFT_239647 [Daphnia pulex]|eukprot:EFX83837.1 hypothetical protein DAPPUDRAFT_239647 [Daphnia pulex]